MKQATDQQLQVLIHFNLSDFHQKQSQAKYQASQSPDPIQEICFKIVLLQTSRMAELQLWLYVRAIVKGTKIPRKCC